MDPHFAQSEPAAASGYDPPIEIMFEIGGATGPEEPASPARSDTWSPPPALAR